MSALDRTYYRVSISSESTWDYSQHDLGFLIALGAVAALTLAGIAILLEMCPWLVDAIVHFVGGK